MMDLWGSCDSRDTRGLLGATGILPGVCLHPAPHRPTRHLASTDQLVTPVGLVPPPQRCPGEGLGVPGGAGGVCQLRRSSTPLHHATRLLQGPLLGGDGGARGHVEGSGHPHGPLPHSRPPLPRRPTAPPANPQQHGGPRRALHHGRVGGCCGAGTRAAARAGRARGDPRQGGSRKVLERPDDVTPSRLSRLRSLGG